LPKGKFHPFQLDTFGLGAVLRAVQRAKAKEIIVGIGGSATNDGGFGLARALGWKFHDRRGKAIERWTDLEALATVQRPMGLSLPRVVVAVDVRNPLLGAHGASRVYGPQKGLRAEDFATAERALRRLATRLKIQSGLNFANAPGAGAAGGLGFGLMTFAGAKFQAGFDLVAQQAALNQRLRQADLVVTGEGAIDRTTAMGKGCGEIARRCRASRIPCVALAGRVVGSAELERMFVQTEGLTDLTEPEAALSRPAFWLGRLAEKIATNWVCKPGARR
jgi:glycerate kinase